MNKTANKVNLKHEIEILLEKEIEGEYWDFKEIHHKNSAELLHDILCMSNGLYNGNKYIIYGVKNSYEVIGVNENRRTQANILEFLSTVKFLGDIRPEIELREIQIDGKLIDVLIILDKPKKPYVLSEHYKKEGVKVRLANVYTRVGDKNTAINKSADLYYVEKMWRQRFGMDLSVIERFRLLLKDRHEWVHNPANKYSITLNDLPMSIDNFPAYHGLTAEFQIELSDFELREEEGEAFCYFYHNQKSFWGMAYLKYYSTVIATIECVTCDEMRIFLPVPEIENLFDECYGNWFYYYTLDNDVGLFLQFLQGNLLLESRGIRAPILIFKNQDMLQAFIEYAKTRKEDLQNMPQQTTPNITEDTCGRIRENAYFLACIKRLYEQWK